MSNLRELSVSIGIEIDDNPLKELNEMFKDIDDAINSLDISSITRLERGTGSLLDEFNDLGAEIRETDSRLGGLEADSLRDIEMEVDNVDNAFGQLKGGIVGIGMAIASAFAVDQIKDFTFAALDAAASSQARDAQFESVFGDLEELAGEGLAKISQETGMFENRLKGSFTQIAAFAKTSGMETAEALSLTERATLAAADSAAFYDRSIEDVTENLQSFLKGNYENDAALGISATEMTRNAAAIDLYGEKFNDLSELEKQFTLLNMIEQGNAATGALGLAAEEANTWENQMGNLKQGWADFLDKVGSPILGRAVDIVADMAIALSNIDPEPFMMFISNSFDKLIELKDTAAETFSIFKDIFSGNGLSAESAMMLIGELGIPPEVVESIVNFGNEVGDKFNFVKDLVSQFVNDVIIPLMPLAQEYVETAFDYIGNVVGATTNVFGGFWSIIEGLFNDVIVPLFPVMKEIISVAFDYINPILELAGSLFDAVASVVRFLVEEVVVPLFPLVTATIETAWAVIEPVLSAFADAFEIIVGAVDSALEKITSFFNYLSKTDAGELLGTIASGAGDVFGAVFGFETGLGRVPYDNMPAYLHKDEAVLQAENADALRDAGILKGDGRHPEIDLTASKMASDHDLKIEGPQDYRSERFAPVSSQTTITNSFSIVVQGGNTNEETAFNIREAMEDFFADLGAVMPQVREG